MVQTVYVDLYFLINFSMDFLCFFLCAKLLSFRLSFPRTVAAAAIGGLYANLALFLSISAIPSLLLDIAACALMCAVALLRRGNVRRLPLYILVYTAVSMVLGGVMTALFHLFNRLQWPIDNIADDDLSVWLLTLLAIAGGLITHLCGRFFSARGARKHVSLSLHDGGHSLTLSALCDTGNLLRDPIGGKCCIVVDCNRLHGFLPNDLLAAAQSTSPPQATLLSRYVGKIRLIPAQSATGRRMLLGIRIERITVEHHGSIREVDALIVPTALSGTADALIPPELLL